jgi:hypothetical protein
LGAAFIHLIFLSWELMPMMKDYAIIFQAHAEGSMAQSDAMINFITKNKLSFQNTNDLISYMQSNPENKELLNRLYTEITAYYQTNLNTATIGASGAVFGILAAFVYLFPNTYLYIYFLIPVKAKWIGFLYFGYELFYALRNSAGDNVARWAHIGGAIVGLLIVISWNKSNRKTLY